eukprot:TRINITY_DN35529_c0_g1_i1.p1 TRINITY_DN35529_c0_g1~~TRINITY_DN35529_c0_g1_i1.p1  ORF type:complete len:564 (-),score=123.44 TRINITY_DN35529_c0_g1_i1:378-2069(-)
MEDDKPTVADLELCARVLRSLEPSDLDKAEVKDVLEAGTALFKRRILKDRFGSAEVVDVLKDKFKLKEERQHMKKIQKAIAEDHKARVKTTDECGINKGRLWRLEALERIKAESALTDLPRVAAVCDIDAAEGEAVENSATSSTAPPAVGDFRSFCSICRIEVAEHHDFYHQLCLDCGKLNFEKRDQTADMTGMICVVTGGRVRIGYCIVLKLLRAGAFVLTTTRFPQDCALRFSKEADFDVWRDRLEVCGPLELCDMRTVERFCDQLTERFPRIHVLINNAAQTLTRRDGWNVRMAELENSAATSLPMNAKKLLRTPMHIAKVIAVEDDGKVHEVKVELGATVQTPLANASSIVPVAPVQQSSSENGEEQMWLDAVQLEDFPEGKLDESLQPLDLSRANSWSRRLGEIPTLELLQTLAANTAAPFIMCSRLASILGPATEKDPFGHIINVSALEGKFSVRRKSSKHPHTNMAKAALNMMTHTSASDFYQRRILMNCADTGWVTDMAPGGVGVVAKTHATRTTPPLDEVDGAARVLDPIFSHLKDPTWLIRGKFFKNYCVAGW